MFDVNKQEPYEAYREMGYREVITLGLSTHCRLEERFLFRLIT